MKDPYRDRKLIVKELPKVSVSLDKVVKESKKIEHILRLFPITIILVLILFDILLWGSIFKLW